MGHLLFIFQRNNLKIHYNRFEIEAYCENINTTITET